MGAVATFVIETYLSRARSSALDDIAGRLRAAIDGSDGEPRVLARVAAAEPAGARAGPPRYLRSFYVADDEIAYHLIEIDTAEAAAELSRVAGLVPERILEAEAATG